LYLIATRFSFKDLDQSRARSINMPTF